MLYAEVENMKYIAHRDEAGREQLLIEHLRNTAARCKYFAAVFQAGQWGEIAGLYLSLIHI